MSKVSERECRGRIIESDDLQYGCFPENSIIRGHALEVLRKLPSDSIDCVVTSPPYWAKRDYGEETFAIWGGDPNCEHEWIEHEVGLAHENRNNLRGSQEEVYGKTGTSWIRRYDERTALFCKKCGAWFGQLGLEPTPQMFVDHLIEIFKEVKRVLKPHGNVFVVIDDTFSGSQGWKSGGGLSRSENEWERGWVKDVTVPEPPSARFRGAPRKSLCLVPELFALRMVYDLGFILRQKIIWAKKVLIYKEMETMGNAMPESARDRQPHCYEYVYHFVKKPKYYYDQDAVRVPYTKPLNRWGGEVLKAEGKSIWSEGTGQNAYRERNMRPNPLGANAPDVVLINTEPFPEAHFATFPERLVEFLIKIGCPEQVCRKCGKTYQRVYDEVEIDVDWNYYGADEKGEYHGRATKDYDSAKAQNPSEVKRRILRSLRRGQSVQEYKPDCSCGAGSESGIVLDPFLGSGTTALVALKNGRKFLGIELNNDYCEMALRRIRPYLSQSRLTDFEERVDVFGMIEVGDIATGRLS